MRMAGEEHFPAGVREKLNGWHWGNHSLVTLHLALNAPPIYSSQEFDPDMSRAFNIIFGFDDTDQVIRCFEQCRRVGGIPRSSDGKRRVQLAVRSDLCAHR
jgi:hypothetical protein